MPESNHRSEYPKYDFKQQQPISEKHTHALACIYHSFSTTASPFLSSFFHIPIAINLTALEQVPFSHYLTCIPHPTTLASLEMPPLKGGSIFEINPLISYSAISLMLGGEGTAPTLTHPLNHLQLAAMRKFMNMLLKLLQEAWNPFADIRFAINEISQGSPLHPNPIEKSESCFVGRFDVSWNGAKNFISLALPVSSLEPIHHALDTVAKELSSDVVHLVRKESTAPGIDINRIDVELKVRVGSVEISKEELQELKPGDVLLLDQPSQQPIDIIVEKNIPFQGFPGFVGKHKGIIVKSKNKEPSS